MKSRKYLISVGIAMGAAIGTAGIAAASSHTPTPPAPAPVVQPQTSVVEPQTQGDTGVQINGVDCEDGIIVATGVECDGGPSANEVDDKNETDDKNEVNDVNEANDTETVKG